MTPLRLSELECPKCHKTKWIIESDKPGLGCDLYPDAHGPRDDPPYSTRPYGCAGCGRYGSGWSVKQQSPPEFLLQPHDMYPMTHAEFDHWVGILKEHFPDHPCLAELGTGFVPRTPEEVAAASEAWERSHPVGEMRDQDGARRKDPTVADAAEWLEFMKPGEWLSFLRRDKKELRVSEPVLGIFSVRCTDAQDTVLGEAADLDRQRLLSIIERYFRRSLAAGADAPDPVSWCRAVLGRRPTG